MFEKKETHESYGILGFARATSGTAVPLFGSSIKHRDTIIMRVSDAALFRELNNDHIMPGGRIIEVEMSQSQFAEAITSMNHGSGVPVTLRYVKGREEIPSCPYVDKRQEFEKEFADCQSESKQYYAEFEEYVQSLLEKKSLGKTDKENLLKELSVLKGRLFSNQEFVYKQFNEQMDKTVKEAKGEIEAFVQNKLNAIASQAIAEKAEDFVSLKSPVDIEE